jgi:DNA-binding NarL/FixJ family response regulator
MKITLTATVIHRHGPGGCGSCPQRDKCSALCSEAEMWANQDYVGQRELTIGLPRTGEMPELPENVYLTDIEASIVTLLGRGLNRRDICELLDMTPGNLRLKIFRIKRKCNGFGPL